MVSCKNNFKENKKEYYVVRYTTNISEYNEFYCDPNKQYLYEGVVGEVHEVEESEVFFKNYFKMLWDQKSEKIIMDSLFSYIKQNAVSDGDTIKNFESIDIKTKQLTANEYRSDCRLRMLDYLTKSDNSEESASKENTVIYDTMITN